MKVTHFLKIEDKFIEDVLSGDKNFEVRINDRGFQKGDKVNFRKINDPESFVRATATISYVLSGYGIKEDWVVFGLKDVSK